MRPKPTVATVHPDGHVTASGPEAATAKREAESSVSRVKTAVKETKTEERNRAVAKSLAPGFDRPAVAVRKAQKARRTARRIREDLGGLSGRALKPSSPTVPTASARNPSNKPGYAPTKAEALAAPIQSDLTKLKQEGKLGKTTGQEIYDKVAEYGPLAIDLAAAAPSIAKSLAVKVAGTEAGGDVIGGSRVARALGARPAKVTEEEAAGAAQKGAASRGKAAAQETGSGIKEAAKGYVRRRAQREDEKALARQLAGTETPGRTVRGVTPAATAAKGAAAQTSAVVRGHEKAIVENPGKVASTTARALPGFITVPIGIAANTGLTVGRAASEAAHVAGIPGAAGYSGKEILAPVKYEGQSQLEFAKQVAKVLTSSDPSYVQKEVEDNLGLLIPISLGLGGKALTDHLGKGDVSAAEAIAAKVRSKVEEIRRARGAGHGKGAKVLQVPHLHREEGVAAARTKRAIRTETHDRSHEIVSHAQKMSEKESLRAGETRSHLGKRRNLNVRPSDLAPLILRSSWDLSHPKEVLKLAKDENRRIAKARGKAGMSERIDETGDFSTQDLLETIEKHPDWLKKPALKDQVEAMRAQERFAVENGLSPDHSEAARISSVAVQHDLPQAHERFPSNVRQIVRAKEKPGIDPVEILRKEAEEDRATAKEKQKKAKKAELDARKKLEPARRKILRAERSEAEVKGVAAHTTAARDRKILAHDEPYMEVVKEANAARRELRSAETAYGNVARNPSYGEQIIAPTLQRLNKARVAAAKAKAKLKTARADLAARVEVEVKKKARGEKASPLADLERGPQGILRRLEVRGGRTLEAQESERAIYEQIKAAKDKAEQTRREAARHNEEARAKSDASRNYAKSHEDRTNDTLVAVNNQIRRTPGLHPAGPEYVNTGKAREAPGVAGSSGVVPTELSRTENTKFKSGNAERYGLSAEGLGNYLNNSIGVPVARRHIFANVRRFLEKYKQNKDHPLDSSEARAVFDDPANPINRKNFVLMDTQLTDRAYKFINEDPRFEKPDLSDEQFFEKLAKNSEWIADVNAAKSGRKYNIVPRAAAEEFLAQMSKARTIRLATQANRISNYLILNTSLAWALTQIGAEYAQAAIAEPRLLNPAKVRAYIKAYHAMDPIKRREFEVWAEGVTRSISSQRDIELALHTGKDATGASKAFSVWNRTKPGRALRDVPKALKALDEWKGGRFRVLTALAKQDRDLNGHLNRFLRGAGNLSRMETEITDRLKGKSHKEVAEFWASHPKGAEIYGKYLDEMLGGWSALTKNERVASQLLIFYPFMRMSLKWTFYSFPKEHPVRAAMSNWLGAQNAQQLQEVLGGKPGFFGEFANVPLYTGSGKTPKEAVGFILPVSRLSVPGNVLTEAVGGSLSEENQGPPLAKVAQSIVQPAISMGLSGALGLNKYTGKQEPHSGSQVLEQVEGLTAPGRSLKKILSSKQDQEGVTALFAKLRGSVPLQVLRSTVLPEIPESVGLQRDLVKTSRVLDTLTATSATKRDELARSYESEGKMGAEAARAEGKLKAENEKAQTELHQLFHKYKIPYKGEERKWEKFEGERQEASRPEATSTLGKIEESVGLSGHKDTLTHIEKEAGLSGEGTLEKIEKEVGLR